MTMTSCFLGDLASGLVVSNLIQTQYVGILQAATLFDDDASKPCNYLILKTR